MKKTFLLLSAAAALTMASCSQEKTTETTATTTTTEAPATGVTPEQDAAYRNRAEELTQRTTKDLNITDTAVVSKIRTTYYNRARNLAEIRNRYTTDTTGRAAEIRGAYTTSDSEFQGVLTGDNQYQGYTTNRPNYYEEEDVILFVPAKPATPARPLTPEEKIKRAAANVAPGETVKGADGSKISKDKDGDIKIKDADGNKAKLAGDDGTVKLKTDDGKKVKM